MSSGLGKSAPLVSLSSGPGASIAQRGVAVPVSGDNHPLAAPPPPPPTVAAPPVQSQQPQATNNAGPPQMGVPPGGSNTTSRAITPPPTAVAPGAMTPPPPNHAMTTAPAANAVMRTPAHAAPSTTSQSRMAKASPIAKSLDDMADAFLSEPSYRTEQLGLGPLLRPSPLPREDGVDRLRTLVERRAWGDVLKIATTMLNSPKDLHATVYASLCTLPLNAPSKQVDISLIPPYVRQETVEIMTLQCHAWLKLRRYADLIAEVERWNFITFNDSTAQSPEWLPWSLRTCLILFFIGPALDVSLRQSISDACLPPFSSFSTMNRYTCRSSTAIFRRWC